MEGLRGEEGKNDQGGKEVEMKGRRGKRRLEKRAGNQKKGETKEG